jgi:hypothetical protein
LLARSRFVFRKIPTCARKLSIFFVIPINMRDLCDPTSEEALLVEGLLYLCHQGVSEVHVKLLTETMSVIATGRGSDVSRTPKSVLLRMNALGFLTTRLDRNGRGIVLGTDVAMRAHEAALAYGVPSMRQSAPGCALCKSILK